MFDPMKTFSAFLSLLCCSWALGIEIDRTGLGSGESFAFQETDNGFLLEWPTKREATAFLYNVGLAKSDTKNLELQWIDPFSRPKSSDIIKETAKVFETRYRSLALSSPNGSVAISPFPHQYLYPLDFAEN